MSDPATDFGHFSRRAQQETIAAINALSEPAAAAHRDLALLHVRQALLALGLFNDVWIDVHAARSVATAAMPNADFRAGLQGAPSAAAALSTRLGQAPVVARWIGARRLVGKRLPTYSVGSS